MRPDYFVFIGFLKAGAGRGFERTPLTPSGSATEHVYILILFCRPKYSSVTLFVTGKCYTYEKSHVLAQMQLRKYEQIIYDKRCDHMLLFALNIRGGSRISEGGGGVGCIKECGFALMILFHF